MIEGVGIQLPQFILRFMTLRNEIPATTFMFWGAKQGSDLTNTSYNQTGSGKFKLAAMQSLAVINCLYPSLKLAYRHGISTSNL